MKQLTAKEFYKTFFGVEAIRGVAVHTTINESVLRFAEAYADYKNPLLLLPEKEVLLSYADGIKMLPIDYIDAEMVKRWFQKLDGLGEEEMKSDISAMARSSYLQRTIKWE